MARHRQELAGLPPVPKFKVDADPFLQFIRTPFVVAFETYSHPGLASYEFLAVNAHLQYGRLTDRRAEAVALFEWIIGKVLTSESPNIMILGDLNFDLDDPKQDLARIIGRFNEISFGQSDDLFVSFPFVYPHPNPPDLHPKDLPFRTNVGLSQTYDQIGVFSRDARVGSFLETTVTGHGEHTNWGAPGFPDYGVFNYSDLFSVALNKKPLNSLSKAKRKDFLTRFEHKVSDHMPIWYRVPLPPSDHGFPTDD